MLKRTLILALPVLVGAGLLASYPSAPVTADRRAADKINRCQTIDQSGSYVLDRNLQAERDCLVVTANNVTIDLAGYTITGAGIPSGGSGIRTAPAAVLEGITVRNGTVTNFNEGIRLTGHHHVVEEIRATHNSAGIATGLVLPNISGNTIRDSIASQNAGTGIVALGVGNSIIGNVATSNNRGIVTGCPSTVLNNVATGNTMADISATPVVACTRLGNSPLP